MIKSWIVIFKKNIHNICTPPLAYTLKESSRACASRAPSSVHSRSWVQPWKPGGSQMPALPPSPASSPAVVWQPLCSPSAPTIYAVGSFMGLPSSSVVGVSLDSASTSGRWPKSAPPWLLAPSSPPWPGSPLAPPGSLVPPAPPWSGFDHPALLNSTPPSLPCPFIPPDLSGSFIPSAPPLSVTPAPPCPTGSTPPQRSPASVLPRI